MSEISVCMAVLSGTISDGTISFSITTASNSATMRTLHCSLPAYINALSSPPPPLSNIKPLSLSPSKPFPLNLPLLLPIHTYLLIFIILIVFNFFFATAEDYEITNMNLRLMPGNVTRDCVLITITDDDESEGVENFTVTATLVTTTIRTDLITVNPTEALVLINDNDDGTNFESLIICNIIFTGNCYLITQNLLLVLRPRSSTSLREKSAKSLCAWQC